MRKLVIIPTYNEKENISAMIDKVFSLPEPFEMLVIDDGSPDGTAAIVKERRKEFPERLHLMERAGKLGLGTAYLAGFRWGLENGFDYICEMDCDFSHNPDDLVRLYRCLLYTSCRRCSRRPTGASSRPERPPGPCSRWSGQAPSNPRG